MLMPLTLKPPPADPVAASGLTQADIDRLRTQIDAFIDHLVAEQRKQMPGLPPEALRVMLMRGQCLCTAAERLLKEQQQ
jgi:hypothetical protein